MPITTQVAMHTYTVYIYTYIHIPVHICTLTNTFLLFNPIPKYPIISSVHRTIEQCLIRVNYPVAPSNIFLTLS
uniref:Uncharacterized protein n=1 Tax=Anguilla anguilla TaxID=7936 RepID=A0A0E9SFH7_ANGAN